MKKSRKKIFYPKRKKIKKLRLFQLKKKKIFSKVLEYLKKQFTNLF